MFRPNWWNKNFSCLLIITITLKCISISFKCICLRGCKTIFSISRLWLNSFLFIYNNNRSRLIRHGHISNQNNFFLKRIFFTWLDTNFDLCVCFNKTSLIDRVLYAFLIYKSANITYRLLRLMLVCYNIVIIVVIVLCWNSRLINYWFSCCYIRCQVIGIINSMKWLVFTIFSQNKKLLLLFWQFLTLPLPTLIFKITSFQANCKSPS